MGAFTVFRPIGSFTVFWLATCATCIIPCGEIIATLSLHSSAKNTENLFRDCFVAVGSATTATLRQHILPAVLFKNSDFVAVVAVLSSTFL